jgi:hypothetical protein
MTCPSAAKLSAAFPHLDAYRVTLIRALAHGVDDPIRLSGLIGCNEVLKATDAYARSCYGDPYDSGMWRRTIALHAIDRILGTCGVEPLGKVHMRGPPYEYCNAGDPWTTTLIYHRSVDALRIGCWGDLAERNYV